MRLYIYTRDGCCIESVQVFASYEFIDYSAGNGALNLILLIFLLGVECHCGFLDFFLAENVSPPVSILNARTAV